MSDLYETVEIIVTAAVYCATMTCVLVVLIENGLPVGLAALLSVMAGAVLYVYETSIDDCGLLQEEE